MSQALHKGFRKILSVENYDVKSGKIFVAATTIFWCIVESQTSRTVRTSHVGITTYIGGRKFQGVSARFFRKPISINLKFPLSSKSLDDCGIEFARKESGQKAFRSYLMSKAKNRTGVVSWFDTSTGSGLIRDDETQQVFSVYACNIKGAKTAFPETACMFLKQTEAVSFDLFDFGDSLSAVSVQGNVYFDAEKWAGLDQTRLAFKFDENGDFETGLFSK